MMVSLMSLWLPILIGAALVFIASSIVHMVLPYHWNDFGTVPKQDEVAAALRPFAIPPGDYMLPRPASRKDMKTPAFQDKVNKGPVVAMTVFPSGQFAMGKQLALWFVYCAVIGLFAGYVASRTLDPGTEYLQVFRVTGTVAFAGYGLALLQGSIWFGRRWSTTLKAVADALVYGLLTAGAFGWLWPS
ncbi:MAG: hypothetical protein HYT81_08315 [Gemmatimonadetes bacterium]|nr:hypothetical protein [Gemmatimonadota bacterium]MBI2404391.1 hypothetical protein [Gemmatimonadota bacterium]MBI3082728.1 hypothetical protein [Gemmatimonadota bacterium]